MWRVPRFQNKFISQGLGSFLKKLLKEWNNLATRLISYSSTQVEHLMERRIKTIDKIPLRVSETAIVFFRIPWRTAPSASWILHAPGGYKMIISIFNNGFLMVMWNIIEKVCLASIYLSMVDNSLFDSSRFSSRMSTIWNEIIFFFNR